MLILGVAKLIVVIPNVMAPFLIQKFSFFQANLIHLGAKYAPCMRWDEVLDREIREERLKERDTACCIRKDRAGCVQSPKTECSKYGDPTGSTPRSNWV